MNERIRELLAEITRLEDELQSALHTQESELRYRLEGTRVRFEETVQQAQRQMKIGLFRWLRRSRPRNILSAPIIYAVIIPLGFLDLGLSLYQLLCFPLYSIPRVHRRAYIVVDRHHLSYLNSIEKINCVYCGYANGVLAYAREIAARTEQYWCPIKHARKMVDPHRRYARFLDYGEAHEYPVCLERIRQSLSSEA